MFIGRYDHRLEEKGRLSIPKKFRSRLENGAIISQGLDGCLFLYPKETWDELIQKLSQLPLTRTDARSFIRSLSYGATEVEIDRLGRILIPDYLRSFAHISLECVVAGAIDRIEIWDKQKFSVYQSTISESAVEIAEKLSSERI